MKELTPQQLGDAIRSIDPRGEWSGDSWVRTCCRAAIAADRALNAPADRDVMRDAVNALLNQIDIGDFVDSHGHSAKMLKPVHDLMQMLSVPIPPAEQQGEQEPVAAILATLRAEVEGMPATAYYATDDEDGPHVHLEENYLLRYFNPGAVEAAPLVSLWDVLALIDKMGETQNANNT